MEFIKPWIPISSILEYANFSNYEVCIDKNEVAHIRKKTTKRTLKPCKREDGYLVFQPYNDDGIQKAIFIHRLIANLCIANPDNKPCVDHDDGIRSNNTLNNLRWCTHSENMRNTKLRINNSSGESNIYPMENCTGGPIWRIVVVGDDSKPHTKSFPRDPNSDIIPVEVIACRNEMLPKYHKDFSRLRRDHNTTI